jgi:hypothetical protein
LTATMEGSRVVVVRAVEQQDRLVDPVGGEQR